MVRYGLILAVVCAWSLLSGCGGGGGGSSTRPSVNPPANTQTQAAIREEIADIGFAANRLVMTDLVVPATSRLFPNVRADTFCGATSCSTDVGGLSLGYTIARLSTITTNETIRVGTPTYGVSMGEVSGRDAIGLGTISADYTVFGGWLDETFFGTAFARWSGSYEGESANGLETVIAFSEGTESGTNPVTGSARWEGLMVGVDTTAPTRAVNGRAALMFDFSDQTLDVSLSNITGPRTYADISWNGLAVQNGRFSGGVDSNSLSGSFYGQDHEEVGGVFERNQLIGAFGASR